MQKPEMDNVEKIQNVYKSGFVFKRHMYLCVLISKCLDVNQKCKIFFNINIDKSQKILTNIARDMCNNTALFFDMQFTRKSSTLINLYIL